MRAELRRLHSPDVDCLASWDPPDPECFGILVQAFIGPLGGVGEESFDFVVCTPRWLEEKYGKDAAVLGHQHILLFTYDLGRIRSVIESLIKGAVGRDWAEVATKIARFGRWEFDGYVEG